MLPASVVLAPVLKGIALEAFQFRRCMERGFLTSACQSLKQNEESFHFTTLPLLFTVGTASLLAGPSTDGRPWKKRHLKGALIRFYTVFLAMSTPISALKKELMARENSQFS